MSLTAAVLQKMLDKGLTLADAVEIAQVWEEGASKLVPSLSKGAARTRKWREKQEAERHGDVTVTHHGDVTEPVTETPPRARVEDISPKLVISGSDDDVDCASAVSSSDDWPKLTGKQTWASILAETVASPWLDPTKSPGLIETAGRIVAWKRDGASWRHDVLPVVTALCVKAGKRVGTWQYFDDSIGRSIAANRAALEIPEAGQVVPLRPGGGASLTDRIAAENAEARRRAIAMLEQRNGKSS